MVRRYGTCIGMHDDVIKWKHFARYWPFVRGIHRSPVNSPHKGQWRGALLFSFICVWTNGWVNNRSAADLRRNRAHYDVSVMWMGAGVQFLPLHWNWLNWFEKNIFPLYFFVNIWRHFLCFSMTALHWTKDLFVHWTIALFAGMAQGPVHQTSTSNSQSGRS